ncbi:MAG: DUF998 domain-containing protein [Pseudomonas sp.]|nr:DUF998 domain-containing protein [Pseudomonas sp.]
MITPIWLLLGLIIASSYYPGYSQINHAMSVLGAVDSPVHVLSPLINNFPLGLLFIAFGLGVVLTFKQGGWVRLSGLLIILHGLGSLGTGLFSCDAGCAPSIPSVSQNIHNLSGLVMLLSLLAASTIWMFVGVRRDGWRGFGFFSIVCTLVAVTAMPLMFAATKGDVGFGAYQRINYFAELIWLAGFAWNLLQRADSGRV